MLNGVVDTGISMNRSEMTCLREEVLARSEGFARQVKGISSIAARFMALLVALLGPIQMFTQVAQAGEPPLPKIENGGRRGV